ncbi:hypothetical protein FH972_024102 [Carpinus fangiana]|uniref:Uncharacterized protein n=1 Tax=Carpinus fangiana TaxID=176857 RepID=A0A5N6KZJ7_9ROSI|nr:hypothetical protein FH972_024102 [Carpinus fangiana]
MAKSTSFLLALASASYALDLATIDPCPACPASVAHPAITVTAQYQVVATCAPSATVFNSTTSTNYPCTASVFVSTVIPTISNGEQGNVTVTKTDQKVRFFATSSVETITSVGTSLPLVRRRFEPRAFGLLANGTNGTALPLPQTTQTSYKTHIIEDCAPYHQIGPIAVPGWDGSGLCSTIGPDANGALTQTLDVTSCLDHSCTTYPETWVESPVTTIVEGITETITITKTVFPDASQAAVPKPGMVQPALSHPTAPPSEGSSGCSQFKLKAVRDLTKFNHGSRGYVAFPGSEGVLVGKGDAATFSLSAQYGCLTTDDKSVCAVSSGPLSVAVNGCQGSWTLNADSTVSFHENGRDVAFCYAQDKTILSRDSQRASCKPVKFVAECGPSGQAPPAYGSAQPVAPLPTTPCSETGSVTALPTFPVYSSPSFTAAPVSPSASLTAGPVSPSASLTASPVTPDPSGNPSDIMNEPEPTTTPGAEVFGSRLMHRADDELDGAEMGQRARRHLRARAAAGLGRRM